MLLWGATNLKEVQMSDDGIQEIDRSVQFRLKNVRPLVKESVPLNNFLISQPKHILFEK